MGTAKSQAWRHLLLTHAVLIERLERELLDECQMSIAWYEVLMRLHEASGDEGLRLTDLAGSLVVSQSNVGKLTERMERAGLVERRPDPGDGRATLATLTQLGRDRFAEASAVHRRGVDACFDSRITIAEARALTGTLAKVLAAQDASVGTTGPVRPARRAANR
jgi:DNA-binding MarR family transcriptional regulator